MSAQPWFINIDDVESLGWMAGRDSVDTAPEPTFVRNSDNPTRIFLLRRISEGGLFSDLNLDAFDSMEVGVGMVDEAPTAGTFKLSVSGDSTGLTALTYNVSAAALQTALNANPSIPSGGVTVTKAGAFYVVTMVNANTALTLTSDPLLLSPPSQADIDTVTAPGVGIQGVYSIALSQSPYAYSSTWAARDTDTALGTATVNTGTNVVTVSAAHGLSVGDTVIFDSTSSLPEPLVENQRYYVLTVPASTTLTIATTRGGSAVDITTSGSGTHTIYSSRDGVTVTELNAGTASTPARYQIDISDDPAPIGGSIRIESGQKQRALISCQANTALYQITTITPAGGGNIDQGTYFDLPDNADAIERFWFDVDAAGTGAPSTPSGGSLTEIDILSTDSQYQVAAKIANALVAHGHWTAYATSAGVVVSAATTAGARSTWKTAPGSSGFTVFIDTAGSAGVLAGEGFILDMPSNATLGVYGTVGGSPSEPPAFAAACTYQVAVALTGGDSATDVATDLAAAIDALADFSASSSNALLTVTCADAGAKAETTTVSSASYFSTAIADSGFSLSATIAHNATKEALQSAIGSEWTADKIGPYSWTITRAAVGTPDAPTVEDAGLIFPIGLDGALSFNTLALHSAFAATDSEELSGYLEIKLTMTGDTAPRVVLHYPATLTRDLLEGTISNVPSFRADDSGSATVTSGADTSAVTFTTTFGTPPHVIVGPITKASPSDDDPPLVLAVYSVTTSGFAIKFSGAPTANATVPWLAFT